MSQELYAAVSGASAAMSQLDIVSNNLANVGTAGFKARQTTFQLAEDAKNDEVLGQAYVEPGESPLDLSSGSLEKTDDPFDLAIQGRGFFTVKDPASGREMLTRAGSFMLDLEGYVATPSGQRLQTTSGPVLMLPGQSLAVGDNGMVSLTDVDGSRNEIGFLKIQDGDVTPVGTTLYEAKGALEDLSQVQLEPGEAPPMQIRQAHLERSNVDPLGAMVELIEASRYFEAYQKMMKASDEADSRLIRTGRT